MALRCIKFTRWGLGENPTGEFITWQDRGTRVAECIGTYRREGPASSIMLRTKYFNGEAGPDLVAGAVQIIGQDAACVGIAYRRKQRTILLGKPPPVTREALTGGR